MVEGGPGGSDNYVSVIVSIHTVTMHGRDCNSPTKRIVKDPTPKQVTVISFSAILDRVDVSVSLSNAISVAV